MEGHHSILNEKELARNRMDGDSVGEKTVYPHPALLQTLVETGYKRRAKEEILGPRKGKKKRPFTNK